MKKISVLLLLFIFISNIFLYAQDTQETQEKKILTYEEGLQDGKTAASTENSFLWSLIGCGATCFFFGLGCLGSTLLGYLIEPKSPYVSYDKGQDYVRGFQNGYSSEVKKKRATSAFVGGCISTVAQTLIYGTLYVIYGAALITFLSSLFSMQ